MYSARRKRSASWISYTNTSHYSYTWPVLKVVSGQYRSHWNGIRKYNSHEVSAFPLLYQQVCRLCNLHCSNQFRCLNHTHPIERSTWNNFFLSIRMASSIYVFEVTHRTHRILFMSGWTIQWAAVNTYRWLIKTPPQWKPVLRFAVFDEDRTLTIPLNPAHSLCIRTFIILKQNRPRIFLQFRHFATNNTIIKVRFTYINRWQQIWRYRRRIRHTWIGRSRQISTAYLTLKEITTTQSKHESNNISFSSCRDYDHFRL